MSERTIQTFEVVKLSDLHTHPNNPRRGDVEALMESINAFGQVRPLVVNEVDSIIVAGNHTAEAIRRVHGPDADVEIVRVRLTRDEAAAYLLADNRLSDKASYDDQQLVDVLEELNGRGRLQGTGYTPDDIDDLLHAIGAIEMPPEKFEGGYAEDPEATAARWEDRDEGARREVVFLLLEEDFVRFNSLVGELQIAWQLESKAETIKQAVEYAHRNNHQAVNGA